MFLLETRDSGLSNGVGLVSVYAFEKKLFGSSRSLLRGSFGENSKFVEHPHSDADLDLRGSMFRRNRALPHNSQ